MNESYKLKLNKAMEHYKIDSLAELKDEDQKSFFAYIDGLNEELSAAQKKLPAGLQKAILAKQGDKKEVKEEDAYDNDRFIIKNGKATVDNSDTSDKKDHVYAPDAKTALQLHKQGKKVYKEELVGGQKKLDKDKDGDIDGKDFAALRKDKTEDHDCDKTHPNESHKEYMTNQVAKEYMNMSASKNKMMKKEGVNRAHRYLETKPGSLEEAVLISRGLVKEQRFEIEGTLSYKGIGSYDNFHMVIDAANKEKAEDKCYDELDKARTRKKIGPGGGGYVEDVNITDIEKTNDKLSAPETFRGGN